MILEFFSFEVFQFVEKELQSLSLFDLLVAQGFRPFALFGIIGEIKNIPEWTMFSLIVLAFAIYMR